MDGPAVGLHPGHLGVQIDALSQQRAAADRQRKPQQKREHAPALFFILHKP